MSINIKTTLGICPRTKLKEKLIIQRGASAEIIYNLLDKGVTSSILEQITFAFSQKRNIFWFNMFKYLIPTEDTEVDPDKTYYKNVVSLSSDTLECEAELVTNPVANPSSANYYEEVTRLIDGQNNLRYLVDPHFKFGAGINGEFVLFTFTPEETALLRPTARGSEIKFEVTLRINTDLQSEFSYHDSVIIDDTQPVIVVKDSLYSQTDSIVVNTNSDNTVSTKIVVRK